MNPTDNQFDDPDAHFTEQLLKEALGTDFDQDILQRVKAAESRLLERKDWLIELLEIGVLDSDDFALKANATMGVYLEEVAAIVGEDACRKMYDYGPRDRVDLIPLVVFRERGFRLTPFILVRAVDDAMRRIGNEISLKIETSQFRLSLVDFIRFCTSKDLLLDEVHFEGHHRTIVCWQAAIMAVFLASAFTGKKVRFLIQLICQLIAASEHFSIELTESDEGFFGLIPPAQEDLASLLVMLSEEGPGDTDIEKWLDKAMIPLTVVTHP